MSVDNNTSTCSSTKSNRISDDSGVVCFNTTAEESFCFVSSPDSSCNTFSGSASAMFLHAERQQPEEDDGLSGSKSLLQYKSVYARNTSFETVNSLNTNHNTPPIIKRREKRGKYVIGSGNVAENVTSAEGGGGVGKYGSKRLTHVQQMRMRFENWCQLNAEAKRCEAVHCKGGREEQRFESLPIIPFGKKGDKAENSGGDSQLIEVNGAAASNGFDKREGGSVNEDQGEQEVAAASLTCDCDNGNGDKEEFPEIGSPPITGEAIENEPKEVDKVEVFELEGEHEDTHHHHSSSDFEEDPEGRHEEQPSLFEVRNAELCEQIEDDDFQLVLLDEPDEAAEQTEDDKSTNTHPDSLNKTFTNLRNVVDELLNCEKTYIAALDKGVKDYKMAFRDTEFKKTLPDALRGKEGTIFGNIDRICDFHRDELLPKLLACDRNVTKICEVFCEFIQKDFFYKYVLYAMNRTKSQLICSQHAVFFSQRQVEIGDKLGLNSFLVKPIQRLPHYKMLFNQMIVELLKNMDDESLKPLIAICCKTEKYVQKLLDTVNESININDIEECYDFQILHQGKFRKMDRFDIYEKYSNYRYKGRLFLFDKSVVYTEERGKRLLYKSHYLRTKIGLEPDRTSSPKPKLILFSEKVGQQCIEVSSDTPVIYEWKSMIDDIIRSFIVEERERIRKGKRPHRAVTLGGKPIEPVLRSNSRGSVYSVKSLISDIGSLSSGSSGGSDRSSKISVDSRLGALAAENVNRRTTWEERKHVETLLNAEKNFLRMFMDNKKFYIDELPEDVQLRLDFYVTRFDDIYWFHTQLYEEMKGCGYDVEKVSELFKTHLKLGNFEIYNRYAVTLGKAESIIGESREAMSSNFYSDRLPLKPFLHLPMKNISDYLKTFNEILDESFTNGGTMTSIFKYCAVIEVEFNQLHRRVMENYRLYALRDDRIHYKIHGQVEQSELVSFNALNVLNYKLLLTKSTLICVHIRSNVYKEKFLSIFFIIPLKHLTMKESKVKPNRLKFASAETRLMHRVIFPKQEKKEAFQRFVIQFQRKIFRL